MALIDPNSVSIAMSQLAAAGVGGPSSVSLATGLGLGITNCIRSWVITTVDVGTLGAGVGVSPVPPYLDTSLALGTVSGLLVANAIAGPSSVQLATAVANTITLIVATATATTVHTTVGVGSGPIVVAPTGAGISIMAASLASSGLAGPSTVNLSTAIGTALDTLAASIVGAVVIAGPPSIVPSTGVGTGVFL